MPSVHRALSWKIYASVVTTTAAITASTASHAAVNLELRPNITSIAPGGLFDVGLYATSDSAAPPSIAHTMAAAQVIFTWNPQHVQLLGLNTLGGPPLIVSSFGVEPYGLNTSLNDGDAMWLGLSPLGNPITISTVGTLLTTFRMQALFAPGASSLNIPRFAGNPTGETIVFDGAVPNLNIAGMLTGATIQIVPAPICTPVLCMLISFAARRRRRICARSF